MRQLTHTPEATEPFPKGHTVATKLHNQMTGADLHPNAIDGTTGTELTAPSQATYDSRYLRTIGGTVTPTSNSTTTLKVTKADGTTQVFDIDTTNARVGINTNAPTSELHVTGSTPSVLVANGSGQGGSYYLGGSPHGLARGNGSANNVTLYTTSGTIFLGANGISSNHVALLTGGNVGIGAASPNSLLQVAGPISTALTNKTAAYTVVATDSTITADASGGTFQVTLPTAASITGRQYTIKRTNATNNVTVVCNGAETIDGATTKTLGSQWAAMTLQSNGANWVITGQMGTVS